MIYDHLNNIKNYKGMNPNLDTAIDFILKTDLNTLPEGRTEIDGEAVFANVMTAQTHELAEDSYEIHYQYMDIQIDLSGAEVIATGKGEQTPLGEQKGDFLAVRSAEGARCRLGDGYFQICMPLEAHGPGGWTEGVPETIRKCVFKVRV